MTEKVFAIGLYSYTTPAPGADGLKAFYDLVRSRGQVRHSYTISALVVSIYSKLRFIKCRYGSTDCPDRDVKYGGDMGHGKSGRQISACHRLVSVAIARPKLL